MYTVLAHTYVQDLGATEFAKLQMQRLIINDNIS